MSEFVVPPVIDPDAENEDLRRLAEWIDSLEPGRGEKHLPGQHDQLTHGIRGTSGGGFTPGSTPHGRYNTQKLTADLEKILYEWNDPSLSGPAADDGAAHLKTENVNRIGTALAERAKKDPELKAQLERIGQRVVENSPWNGTSFSEEGTLQIEEGPGLSVYQRQHLHLAEGMTIAEVGAREVAAKMQDAWMQSASDDSELSWGMQLAVAKKMGIDDSAARSVITKFLEDDPDQHAEWFMDHGPEIGLPPFGGGPLEAADRVADSPAVKAYVDEVYGETQRYLAEREIDEITVYRGVHLQERLLPGVDPNITLNPLSSFTTKRTVAENFAQQETDRERPYILTTTVPADRVFSIATTGPGCLSETELLVVGGPNSSVQVEEGSPW